MRTYRIALYADEVVSVTRELTDAEAALLRGIAAEVERERTGWAPTMDIEEVQS